MNLTFNKIYLNVFLLCLLSFQFNNLIYGKILTVKSELHSINNKFDCVKLLVYFDIDNTANSYFNNITYFVNKVSGYLPNEYDNYINILVAEDLFDDEVSKAAFINRFILENNWRVNLIESDSILESFNDVKGLAKYRFLKNNNLTDSGTCKWDFPESIHEILSCDTDPVNFTLKLLDKFNIRKNVTSSNNVIKIMDSARVVVINDYHNKVLLLNYANSELSYKEFKWDNKVKPQDIYCQYFAKTQDDCEYAKKNSDRINESAKSEIYFTYASFSDSFIYVAMNFYANEMKKEDYYFINDLGNKDTLFKGSMIASQYSIIVKLDKDLNFITFFPVSDEGIFSEFKEKLLAGIDFGFEMIENTNEMICFLPTYKTVFEDNNVQYSIGNFKLNNQNVYEFTSFCNVPYPDDFSKKWFVSSFVNPGIINNKIAVAFGSYDWFYIDSSKVFIDKERDKTTLPEENIITYLGQNEVLKYNYHILGISEDYSGKYIFVFYKLANEFYIEVLNSGFKSIQTLNLRSFDNFPEKLNFDDLDEGAFDLNHNILSFNYRDKSAVYLMRFKLMITN